MDTKVIARVPFTYMGRDLDRGELWELKGSPRDALLVSLKYFILYDVRIHERKTCDTCGRVFYNYISLTDHKRKPDCMVPSQEITKRDFAETLELDPDKVKVED